MRVCFVFFVGLGFMPTIPHEARGHEFLLLLTSDETWELTPVLRSVLTVTGASRLASLPFFNLGSGTQFN